MEQGSTPNAALEFIHLVVQHKVRSGTITMPQFAVHLFADQNIQAPAPWQVVPPADMPDPMPSPFLALPPRGRRHVLCQLERQAPEKQEEDSDEEGERQEGVKYIFSVFGGIYAFRGRFEEHSIQGAQVQVDPNTQEYVRMVEFSGLEEGKSSLTDILQNCLQQIPVFFVNMAGSQDEAPETLTLVWGVGCSHLSPLDSVHVIGRIDLISIETVVIKLLLYNCKSVVLVVVSVGKRSLYDRFLLSKVQTSK